MSQVGLVLEGGGMRGLYTTGVLDFFLEKELYFPYVIGVSAGAVHGSTYLSRQQGRNRRINLNYIDDPRYLSVRSLIAGKGLFGMDFAFGTIPKELDPVDVEAFYDYEGTFLMGVTDCQTGEAVYFDREDCLEIDDVLTVVKASSSLPFVAPKVEFRGRYYLDGGLVDPIPIKKSIDDGNEYNVVVSTRPPGYRKDPNRFSWLAKLVYWKYPGVAKALKERHEVYNQTREYIEELKEEGRVFEIRPQESLNMGRMEKDKEKLLQAHERGFEGARSQYEELKTWLKDKTGSVKIN